MADLTRPLAETDDDSIVAALELGVVPPLLTALAGALDDPSLVPDHLRPDLSVFMDPTYGMSPAQIEEAKALALAAIQRLRSEPPHRVRALSVDDLRDLLAYITGGGIPGSLSPDGRQAAFTVDDAVWVVDLDGGDARRITNQDGFVWAVSWSPTGEWITYTRFHGPTTTISLVRPDGTDQREISKLDETDEANSAYWSPDGRYLVVNRDSDASADGPKDIWLMDLDGRYVGQVTHTPSQYSIYGWAPMAS